MVSYTTPSPLNAEHSHGPNPYNAAKSFTESDLTLTTLSGSRRLDRGSLGIGYSNGTTADRTNDNNTSTVGTGAKGHEIVPNNNIGGVRADVSANTDGVDTIVLTDANENIIDERTGSFTGGDTVELLGNLNSGTKYYVGVWNSGGGYTTGYYGSPSFPYTSTDIDIERRATGFHPNDGATLSTNTGTVHGIDAVTALKGDPSVTVALEWPYPPDIYEWDVATFTRTLDGETVDVYVAYNNGSGWQRTNGGNAITRNYSLGNDSNISASDHVRIEADLSRTNTANNPTLDSAYRTWRL